jgi:para-nitrobenzyl esterase
MTARSGPVAAVEARSVDASSLACRTKEVTMLTTDVETADGVVRGRRGRLALRWQSIPYAAPPVGQLRLRAPQPTKPWAGVRDATRFGNAAVQPRNPMVGLRRTGEDCLTLNVTAPPGPADRPRPVLVFVHGGSYMFDTAARYEGDALAARGDVVVVTINYRLGALGYFDFTEFSTTGRPFESNLGLRDQVAALRWVHRNIAAFGGDPGNVTIFGESAGGHAVLTLMTTPSATGLFHRVIAQSANADKSADPEAARLFARRFVARLGATPDNAAQALSTAAEKDLCRAAGLALSESQRACPGSYPLAPVADGDFLPLHPLDAFAAGRAAPVPLMIGTNHDECTLFQFDEGTPTSAPVLRAALERCGDDYERIVAAYPGYPTRAAAVRVSTDFVYWRPTVAVAEAHGGRAPTFCYRFDFAPRALRLTGVGAIHGLELLPVFGRVDSLPARLLTLTGGRQGFRAVQDEVQGDWLAFARTGRPRSSWPEYTAAQRNTRVIDHPSRVEADPRREHRLLWDGLRVPAPK